MVKKLKKQKPIAKIDAEHEKNNAVIHLKKEKIAYSGIIPHPNIVEGYEKLCQGATDRILRMTEDELVHKRELEKKEEDSIIECRKLAIKGEIWTNILATIFAYILLFSTIIGAIYLLSTGKKVEGLTALLGVVGTCIASAFWKNYINSKSMEDIEKIEDEE